MPLVKGRKRLVGLEAIHYAKQHGWSSLNVFESRNTRREDFYKVSVAEAERIAGRTPELLFIDIEVKQYEPER